MPRDGSGNYSPPPGTLAVTDTTIDSAKYNAFVNDLQLDANTPRPIVAGGTGSTSAAAAMAVLGGELAKQIVADYNTQVFQAGSFYSDNTAGRHAPVDGHAFSGICYVTDASNMYIEARDQDDSVRPGRKYTRQLKAGVWSAWAQDTAGSGSASANGPWLLSNVTTFPPALGQVRFNNTSQGFATHVYVSHQTNTGTDMTAVLSSLIAAGGKIYVQDAGTPGNYVSFNVTSVVFTAGDADATVTVADNGGTIANGAAVNLTMQPPAGATMYVRYDTPQPLSPPQQLQAAANINAVAKTGDTMTGALTISMPTPVLNLIKTTPTNPAGIFGYNGANARWQVQLGGTQAESGSSTGSDFAVVRYTNAGAVIDAPLIINRSDGSAALSGPITVTKGITSASDIFVTRSLAGSPAQGSVNFGNAGAYLYYDGTEFIFNGGPVYRPTLYQPGLNNTAMHNQGYNSGVGQYIYGGVGSGQYFAGLGCDGNGSIVHSCPNDQFWCYTAPGGSYQQIMHLVFDGRLYVSGSYNVSDARLKKNVRTLEPSIIEKLRPVSFNWVDPERPSERQLGFIAQEVAEIAPSLVSAGLKGKDGVDLLCLNSAGIIPELVATVQRLLKRVAELEAR